MKKKISFEAVITGSFFAFLGLLTAGSILLPHKAFSETENRYLARFPELTWETVKNGDFGMDYETYLSDHFPFRDTWIGFQAAAEKLLLKKEINGVFLGKDGYLIEALYPEDLDPENCKKNLDTLTDFSLQQAGLLGEAHVRVLLAPSSSEILTEKLPAHASPLSQSSVTDALKQAGLSPMLVPVKEALLEEKEAFPLYYKTDHHWTSHGAFTAYEAWAESAGLTPFSRSDFAIETVTEDFSGTILSRLNIPAEPDSIQLYKPKNEPEWSVYYDGNSEPFHSLYAMDALDTRDKYRVFLDGNHGFTRIVNPRAEGTGKLLVIKDSYAHSFVPFAALHFPEVIMIDLRYFNGKAGELIRTQNVTDVLILYQIPGFLKDRNISRLR